jgi:hypothetical protein
MIWFVDRLKQLTKTEPIECPRGWGSVQFKLSVVWILLILIVERKCPISGKENCSECRYARNPDAFLLRENLEELTKLKREGLISAGEHDARQVEMLALFPAESGTDVRAVLRTATLILGPLGVVFTLAGAFLGFAYDAAFLFFACVGLIGLALALSFTMIVNRQNGNDLEQGG